ncbi:MAG: CCA tRNA nucleotidyltransferase [Lachnospiraceae bacterium]|nr:CCA tRNA nucleotidyltransferase [Lachnospiraceae bacterium]
MEIRIPEEVRRIIGILEEHGHEAYAVGGCVRDSLLYRVPEDWDITTSAMPAQVKALFRRTVDTGIAHGTVTVMMGKKGFEVTTYRVDGDYEDSRHPKQVTYTKSLPEDLKRRDFTINAMAYNPGTGLVDPLGGEEDLRKKVIRCVGSARERFTEDALRILRAIRFSAQLGFSVEPRTREAAHELVSTLARISRERIQAEITKLLVSDNPQYFRELYEAGITAQIFPEFDVMMETGQNTPYHCYTVGEHTLAMLGVVGASPVLRWTALLHDCGKPWSCQTDASGRQHFKGHEKESAGRARRILKELKFDNDTVDQVTKLIAWHTARFEGGKYEIRKCLNQIGVQMFPLLLEVDAADAMAKNPVFQDESLRRCARARALYQEILADGDCFRLDRLAVSGGDLREAGMKPGPLMGAVLNRMLDEVMKDPSRNTKEYLLANLLRYAGAEETGRED